MNQNLKETLDLAKAPWVRRINNKQHFVLQVKSYGLQICPCEPSEGERTG